jgi:hypothetical protein
VEALEKEMGEKFNIEQKESKDEMKTLREKFDVCFRVSFYSCLSI